MRRIKYIGYGWAIVAAMALGAPILIVVDHFTSATLVDDNGIRNQLVAAFALVWGSSTLVAGLAVARGTPAAARWLEGAIWVMVAYAVFAFAEMGVMLAQDWDPIMLVAVVPGLPSLVLCGYLIGYCIRELRKWRALAEPEPALEP